MIRPRGRRRPFTLVDGMILLTGLFLGIMAAERIDPKFLEMTWVFHGISPPWPWMPDWGSSLELPLRRVQVGLIAALVPISLAVALATFRRPFGGLRRVGISPGLAGSAAVAGGVAVDLAVNLLIDPSWRRLDGAQASYWTNLAEFFKDDVTAPLAAVWACQVAGRCWRPRDDWRDWLGRWLGGAWLLTIAIDLFCRATWG